MRIVIFGWNKNAINSGGIQIKGPWQTDGPRFALEFSCIYEHNGIKRLELAIRQSSDLDVPVLYAESAFTTLNEAAKNLAINEFGKKTSIGWYNFTDSTENISREKEHIIAEHRNWNKTKNFDLAIWNDQGTRFYNGKPLVRNLNTIKEFFMNLSSSEFDDTKQHIFDTHPQIQTKYRKQIEELLESIKK